MTDSLSGISDVDVFQTKKKYNSQYKGKGDIVVKNEEKLIHAEKKKKRKREEKKEKEKENDKNEKILLFENNEIVEYTPTYVKNKNNYIVLPEDDYINTLEKIIERDYFPDIAKYKSVLLSKQKKHVDKEDKKKCHISSSSCSSVSRNSFSNLFSGSSCQRIQKDENNISDPYNDNKNLIALYDANPFFNLPQKEYQLVLLPNGKEHKINLNMSLREFQKKYTSEDNKSFECLLNKIKNEKIEKNMYSIEKRKKHNLMIEQIEKYTQSGINCHMLHTNKADREEIVMKFSSDQKISDVAEVKKHKVDVNSSNTRFSQDDNAHIEKQLEKAGEINRLRLLKKINEDKTEQMIAQGKFDLLKENNGFNYVRTPLSEASKGLDGSSVSNREESVNSSIPSDSDNDKDSHDDYKNDCKNKRNLKRGNKKEATREEEEDEDEDEDAEEYKNEFRLQKQSKRELLIDRLQNNIKDIKYNKQALRNKYLKSFINKRFSSKMSTTSFKHSVLSKYSQRRLNELAQKSSLASQLLRDKRSKP